MALSRLSLVTPSMDQRQLLRECLANVCRVNTAVEHIVVDGGSTDGTLAVLRDHARQCPDTFSYISEPDRGMYDALNKGFARTGGEILGYLNCDDLLLPWAVATVLARFDEADRPDIVYGDALEWEPATGRAALVVQPPAWMLPGFLRAGGHLAQPAVFFRRSLYDRLGGFDPTYRLLGDHDLWLRALQSGARFASVDEVLAIQRVVEGQLMQRHAERVDAERARCFSKAGLRSPGAASRRGANLVCAALHRAGLIHLWRARDAQGDRRGPWRRCVDADLILPPSTRRVVNALVRTTRGQDLLQLDLDVLARLTGVPDLARRRIE